MRHFHRRLPAALLLSSLCLGVSSSVCLAHSALQTPLQTSDASGKMDTKQREALERIIHDTDKTAEERIAAGIALLKDEIAHPSPPAVGPFFGEPIDNASRARNAVVTDLRYAVGDTPSVLRQIRDQTTDRNIRDYLTLALGHTDAQDTIPDLLRIFHTAPDVHTRASALYALSLQTQKPERIADWPRVASGTPWRPLPATTQQSILEAFLAGLQDTFVFYNNECTAFAREEDRLYSPVAQTSREALRLMGYTVRETKLFYVVTKEGRTIRSVPRPQFDQLYKRLAEPGP
jgi:hypothetical protein